MTLRDTLKRLRREAKLTPEEQQRRSARQTGELTQLEAALRVGAPRVTWNKWESKKGGRQLSAYYARSIEAQFGLPEGALEEYVEETQRAATPAERADFAERLARVEAQLEHVLSVQPEGRVRKAAGK